MIFPVGGFPIVIQIIQIQSSIASATQRRITAVYAEYFDMQWLSITAIPKKMWNVHNLAANKRTNKVEIPSGIVPSEKLVQVIMRRYTATQPAAGRHGEHLRAGCCRDPATAASS